MIEMGKKYRTRDGRKWRLLCVDARGKYPVVGLLETFDETGEITACYDKNGKIQEDFDSGLDLVEISPYDNWPIGAPVWVERAGRDWVPRHFAGVDENGSALVWRDGLSSHTASVTDRKLQWGHVKLASEFTPNAEERGDD